MRLGNRECIISALTFSAYNKEIIVIVIVIAPHYHDLYVRSNFLSSTSCEKSSMYCLFGITVWHHIIDS